MKKILFPLATLICLIACNQPQQETEILEKTKFPEAFNESRILEAVKNFPVKGNNNQIYPLTEQLDRIKEEVSANFKKLAQEESDYQSKLIWQAFHDSYKQMTYEWYASELSASLWEVMLIMHQPSPAGDDLKQERTFIVDTINRTIQGNSQSCQFLDENLTGKFHPNETDHSAKCRFKMPNL